MAGDHAAMRVSTPFTRGCCYALSLLFALAIIGSCVLWVVTL